MDGYVPFVSVIPEIPRLPQLHGTAVPCVATDLLEGLSEGDKRSEQEQIAKNCAAVAFFGTCVRFVLRLFGINCVYRWK